jgi:hypothetical protein
MRTGLLDVEMGCMRTGLLDVERRCMNWAIGCGLYEYWAIGCGDALYEICDYFLRTGLFYENRVVWGLGLVHECWAIILV